jgi:hypothetical protein
MNKLPTLYTAAVAKVGKDPHIAAADVIAVCLQESGGQATFSPQESLYRDNMAAAVSWTTLPEELLLDALLIKQGPWSGQIAKFRFEPSYWQWAGQQKLPSPTDRFLCSCSFGVGQQMMKWVLPQRVQDWPVFIDNFKSTLDIQLTYLMINLRTLLINNGGSLNKAYRAYNSGNPNSKDPDVIKRALHVVKLRDIVVKQLRG